jgi:hypothetical protein
MLLESASRLRAAANILIFRAGGWVQHQQLAGPSPAFQPTSTDTVSWDTSLRTHPATIGIAYKVGGQL